MIHHQGNQLIAPVVLLVAFTLSLACSAKRPSALPGVGGTPPSAAEPSSATASLNSALRDSKVKLVFLSFCNGAMKGDEDRKREFTGFLKDPSVGSAVQAICVDPDDPREEALVKQLGVDPKIPYPVTIAIAPPGKIMSSFRNYPTPQDIRNLLSACSSGGCGPSG